MADENHPETPKKIHKNPHCEKLLREADEDSWISGEELRTEGSSEEDATTKKHTPRNKVKNRKKSKESVNPPAKKPSPVEASTSAEEMNKWRPKRGSLTLPKFPDAPKNESHQTDFLQEIAQKIAALEYLHDADFTRESSEIGKFYGDARVKELYMKIKELEYRVGEEMSQLRTVKEERLKTQEEMCQDLYQDESYYTENSETFLNICHYEDTARSSSEESDQEGQEPVQKSTKPAEKCKKNFIRRNIELAAKAMSTLPLTDEEKHKLEELLSDPEFLQHETLGEFECLESPEKNQHLEAEDLFDLQNAFKFSDLDQRRMGEIDTELQNFPLENADSKVVEDEETSGDAPLKAPSSVLMECNLWPELTLEQALKDIDRKLADIEDSEQISIREEDSSA